MLAELALRDWQIIIALTFVAGIIFGFIADGILGHAGFGVMLSAVVVMVGGVAGLFALEWMISHHYVYAGRVHVAHWLGAWLGGATTLLLVSAMTRGFVHRNAHNPWVMSVAYLAPMVVTVGFTARVALTVFK